MELELRASVGEWAASEEDSCMSDELHEADEQEAADEPDQSRWKTRNAVVSEPQLLTLAREIPVECCGLAATPALKRISMSFAISWVGIG